MNKNISRGVLIPAFVIILTSVNMIFVEKVVNIQAIHIVSLLTIGFALGMLVMNLITMYKNSKEL